MSGSPAFQTVFVFVMGFTQTQGRITGIERCWRDVRPLSSPTVHVRPPDPWKSDPEAIAALINRNTTYTPRIVVTAYSWGGGWFFPRFARALGDHGMAVDHAILCDPVYRSPLLPTAIPFNPLSMIKSFPITIPANVRRVTWFRQKRNRPQSQGLKAESPQSPDNPNGTLIEEPTILDVPHEKADDDRRLREAVARAAGLTTT